MKPLHLMLLLTTSAIWGLGFTLTRLTAPYFGPVLLVELRLLLAGLLLLGWALWARQDLGWREHWRTYLVLGVTNAALPFVLASFAVGHIGASFATIINSTLVLFAALLAGWWLRERLTLARGSGLGLGLLGVMVLVGWSPVALNLEAGLSIAAMLVAAFSLGFSNVFTKVRANGAPVPGIVAGQTLLGSSLLALPSAFTLPAQNPPLWAWLLLGVVAVLATAGANLMYFYLIAQAGAVQASSAGFLIPLFGVLFGVVLLHEPLTWSVLAGMGLILLGVALTNGVLKPRGLSLQPSVRVKPASH